MVVIATTSTVECARAAIPAARAGSPAIVTKALHLRDLRSWSASTPSSAPSTPTSTCSRTPPPARPSRSTPPRPASTGSPGALDARGWTLKLIVSTHGHWDHVGENAAVAEHTGAPIAIHPADNHYLLDPRPLYAPFPIVPSVPAVELAEGGEVRFGEIRLRVLHTPGHTEGSVCLLAEDDGMLFSGDTLFPGGWGRVDLPGGSPEAMADSDRAAGGPRRRDSRAAGPRGRNDDRPRAPVARPRAPRGAAAVLRPLPSVRRGQHRLGPGSLPGPAPPEPLPRWGRRRARGGRRARRA